MSLTNEEKILLKNLLDKLDQPILKVESKIVSFAKFISPIHWKEDVAFFKTKKLMFYVMLSIAICLCSYFYGYYKQKDIRIPISGNEIVHILKSGDVTIETKDGKVLKSITKTDVNALKNEMSPVALQLKFIGVVGSSFGTGANIINGGAGISWLRLWKCELDSFVTNSGIFPIGVSYGLKAIHLPNSAIGIAVGKGFKNDGVTQTEIYFKVNF